MPFDALRRKNRQLPLAARFQHGRYVDTHPRKRPLGIRHGPCGVCKQNKAKQITAVGPTLDSHQTDTCTNKQEVCTVYLLAPCTADAGGAETALPGLLLEGGKTFVVSLSYG